MSKKMYYSEAEAAGKLHMGVAELSNLVRDQKLRAYMDGARKMFKVQDVDELAAAKGGQDDIVLSPAESSISLSAADSAAGAKPGKEDTVITAEGISIFDDEDLEIEAADPMAKTQIAPGMEEQASEGVGSGSGLLDLTRESDDTSLGAEVLDHIDMTGSVGSGLAVETTETPAYAMPAEAQQQAVVEVAAVETMDAVSGSFGGLVIGAAFVMLLLSVVVLSTVQGALPSIVEGMKDSIAMVLIGCVAVIAIAAVAGLMMGKAVAARASAAKKAVG